MKSFRGVEMNDRDNKHLFNHGSYLIHEQFHSDFEHELYDDISLREIISEVHITSFVSVTFFYMKKKSWTTPQLADRCGLKADTVIKKAE